MDKLIVKVLLVLVAVFCIVQGIGLWIELALMEQYEIKGPDIAESKGIYLKISTRVKEIQRIRFISMILIISNVFLLLLSTILIYRHTKSRKIRNKREEILE